MPNTPISHNSPIQNGRHSPAPLSEPSHSVEPAYLDTDWASTTKELLDALPRVWTRGLLYLLAGLIAIVLPWAILFKVDETGSARGRIEPKGKTLRLDASIAAAVSAIRVREGQIVQAGQVLLEFDAELVRNELQQAQVKLEGQQNRVSQLEIMRNQLEIALKAQRLQSQAQQAAQRSQFDQARQQLSFSRNAQALAQKRLVMDQGEVDRYQNLSKQGAIPQVKVVEVERSLSESQQLLNQAQSEIKQSEYKINEQQNNYENAVQTGQIAVLDSERRLKELQSQISTASAEIGQTTKQVQGLQFQLKQRVLRSPTKGTVFKLFIDNAGAVVPAGQPIVEIAPKDSPFVFRAQIPSYDSGFLSPGLPVKLKFDAYPFQDYGVVPGHLRWISPDSKVVETIQGKVEVFELEIVLDQTSIQTQDKQVSLAPGQTATAEVIIRQRRIIDFVLDPFKKLQKGDFKL